MKDKISFQDAVEILSNLRDLPPKDFEGILVALTKKIDVNEIQKLTEAINPFVPSQKEISKIRNETEMMTDV